MIPFSRTRLAAGILMGAILAAGPARAASPLDAYLPASGTIVGHVMKLGVALEDQAIDRQFKTAVQANMDWFKKYVTGQKSGVPLPYDHRMGISEAQYEQLQHMKADFQPGAPITITIAKNADGSLTLGSPEASGAVLKGVIIPPEGKKVETPYGDLAIVNAIHQTNANAPIGVWNGIEWAKVEESGADLPSAKIAFGKREPSGEGVMYYQVAPYKDHEEQSLVVFYKLDSHT